MLTGIIVSVVLAAVGLWFAYFLYRKESRKTNKLDKLDTLIIRGLHEAGLVKYNFDEGGRPIGIAFRRGIFVVAHGAASISKHVSKESTAIATGVPSVRVKVIRRGERDL